MARDGNGIKKCRSVLKRSLYRGKCGLRVGHIKITGAAGSAGAAAPGSVTASFARQCSEYGPFELNHFLSFYCIIS